MSLTLPVLYKYSTRKQIQEWSIVVDGDSFYTIEGIQGGKLTTSLPTVCTGKNIGRSNETTPEQQAVLEARAKWQKKVDKGYNEILTDEEKFFQPMLANDAKESKDLDFKKRTFVQPKLDGLRADNEGNKLMSRNGKPYVACPHLYQDKTRLDGELYTHEYKDDFNKIVSLCKKAKPTDDELAESARKVEMWVYDFPNHNGPFSERYSALAKHIASNPQRGIVIVPTYEVFSWDDVRKYHEQFLAEGYEGTIIRIDLGPYENKRSKQLLKYKDFVDAEFKIVGYEEGIGGRTGTIGFFVMEDADGKQFKSNVKGNFDYLKQVWKDRDTYIGKSATVKYFNLTPLKEDGTGGVPRFPYIIKINREEYE
jgi:DNA ligase-1